MGYVQVIPHQQLQSMLARRQFQLGLGLSTTKMNMLLVGRDRLIQCWQVVQIHKQVMVPRAFTFHTRWRYTQTLQTEPHRQR